MGNQQSRVGHVTLQRRVFRAELEADRRLCRIVGDIDNHRILEPEERVAIFSHPRIGTDHRKTKLLIMLLQLRRDFVKHRLGLHGIAAGMLADVISVELENSLLRRLDLLEVMGLGPT